MTAANKMIMIKSTICDVKKEREIWEGKQVHSSRQCGAAPDQRPSKTMAQMTAVRRRRSVPQHPPAATSATTEIDGGQHNRNHGHAYGNDSDLLDLDSRRLRSVRRHGARRQVALALVAAVLACCVYLTVQHYGALAAAGRRDARLWLHAVTRVVPCAPETLDATAWRAARRAGLPRLWPAATARAAATAPLRFHVLARLEARGAGRVRVVQSADRHFRTRDADAAGCAQANRNMLPALPCTAAESAEVVSAASLARALRQGNVTGWAERSKDEDKHQAEGTEEPDAAGRSGYWHVNWTLVEALVAVGSDPQSLPTATWPFPPGAEIATPAEETAKGVLPPDYSAAMADAAAAVARGEPAPLLASKPLAAPSPAGPSPSCYVHVGHAGVALVEAWSLTHRLVVGLDGSQRVLLFPGSEIARLSTYPDFHPYARQPRRLPRALPEERTQRATRRPRAWVHAVLLPGERLYVPPGWTPSILPLTVGAVAVCTASGAVSLAAEVQRRVLAAVPAPLFNASLPLSQRHHLLRVHAQALASAAIEDMFANPQVLLQHMHSRRLLLLPVAYAEAPTLASQPPLTCAQRRRPLLDKHARHIVNAYDRHAAGLIRLLPVASRPPLVIQAIDALVEHLAGLHNVFVFYASCL